MMNGDVGIGARDLLPIQVSHFLPRLPRIRAHAQSWPSDNFQNTPFHRVLTVEMFYSNQKYGSIPRHRVCYAYGKQGDGTCDKLLSSLNLLCKPD